MSQKILTGVKTEVLKEIRTATGLSHKAVFPRPRIKGDPKRAINVYQISGTMRYLGMASTMTDFDYMYQVDCYGRSDNVTGKDAEAIIQRWKDNRFTFFDQAEKKWWRITVAFIRDQPETGIYHKFFFLFLSKVYV